MAANFMRYLTVLLSICCHLAAGIDVTISGVGTVSGTVDTHFSAISLKYFMVYCSNVALFSDSKMQKCCGHSNNGIFLWRKEITGEGTRQ